MRIFKRAAAAAVFSVLGVTSASALVLDFDTGTSTFSGTNNLVEYSQGGFEFDISQTGAGSSGANLFNTLFCVNGTGDPASCAGTDDGDLVPLSQTNPFGVAGNILIRQETPNAGNNQGQLDDDARMGGRITLTLTAGKAFRISGFSGIDEQPIFLDVGAQTCGPLALPGDRAVGQVDCTSSLTQVVGVGDSFDVRFAGSGGVDSIALAPVPLPAALGLMLAALGSFGFIARRRAA